MAYAAEKPGELLDEIRRRVAGVVVASKVYLFGSRAWGPAAPDSDYDLLIVLPDDSRLSGREAKLAMRRALRGLGVPVDLIVESESEFAERAASAASLEALISERGILLHG